MFPKYTYRLLDTKLALSFRIEEPRMILKGNCTCIKMALIQMINTNSVV